jgi:hypothetical protein
MTRTIVGYNQWHLGDNIFNFILFYNIKNYLEENDIHIEYHLNEEHFSQVSEFNCSKNIHLSDSSQIGLNMWIGNQDLKASIFGEVYNIVSKKLDFYLVAYCNEILQKIEIPFEMKTFEYTDPDLLVRYELINNEHQNKYADLDFLILNSNAMSGQYYKDDNEWNFLINQLNAKFKIAVSEKVEGVLCTRDDNLTIKDIAAISTHAKKIIAVSSGPIIGLFNTYTLNNVEVVYAFANNDIYGHPKFISNSDIKNIYFLAE